MHDLIPFQFGQHPVRVHVDDAGDPWWIATDVGAAIGHTNITMLLKRVDEDEKALNSIYPGGVDAWFINESGLYNLVLGSRKPEAKNFKRWVTHEVLPAIRKTGKYDAAAMPVVRDPAIQLLIDMAVRLDEARTLAETAHQRALTADHKAQLALNNQQWLSLREYTFLHDLARQLPPSLLKDFGIWLSGYCLERGIPVRKIGVADRPWEQEHSYHVETITVTLPGWLLRRQGQTDLALVPQGGRRQR